MMTRRKWLAAATAASAADLAAKPYSVKYAAGCYVWTQHYARLGKNVVDYREEMFAGFAAADYKAVSLMSQLYPVGDEKKTAELARKYKIEVPLVYNGGPMHTEEGAAKTIESTVSLATRAKAVHKLEAITFNATPLPGRTAKSDSELRIQSAAISRLGAELKKQNVRLLVHQHDPEMADNAREWRHILKNTDPGVVEICLDTHWVLRGRQDVMTILKEASPRLGELHLRNSKAGIWSEDFGDGEIDYRAVAAYLKQSGFRGWLTVELAWDKETQLTRTLPENLKRSLQYARSVFG